MPKSAFTNNELAIVRRAFARQMLAVSGIESDAVLEQAFATTLRERFLGAPPWRFVRPMVGYESLLSEDPAVLYQDVLVALASERGVNNGSLSLHARWLHALQVRDGDTVAHIGAGTGYYTALLAHLVGPRGQVLAMEIDPALADRARTNLASRSNVMVVEGDGAAWPRDPVDAVYVNFAAGRPAEAWIEQLTPGGRLVFPLGVPGLSRGSRGGTHAQYGAGLRVIRRETGFQVDWLNPASFVCAEGSLSATSREGEALRESFQRGGIEFVRSLIWRRPASPDRCWFTGPGWALSYDEVEA